MLLPPGETYSFVAGALAPGVPVEPGLGRAAQAPRGTPGRLASGSVRDRVTWDPDSPPLGLPHSGGDEDLLPLSGGVRGRVDCGSVPIPPPSGGG